MKDVGNPEIHKKVDEMMEQHLNIARLMNMVNRMVLKLQKK
jgi:hypothetical protein